MNAPSFRLQFLDSSGAILDPCETSNRETSEANILGSMAASAEVEMEEDD